MNTKSLLTLLVIICLVLVPQYGFAKILFMDDFESDVLGNEPSKWKVVDDPAGEPPGEIVEDPDGGNNKVLLASLRGDKNGRIYVVGEADWADYVAQFDWYLSKDGIQHGTVFRYTDRDSHYLFDRRSPAVGAGLQFYRRQAGGWTNFGTFAMQTDIKTWYTVMLSVQGDKFTAKMRKKDEKDPFSKLDVLLEGTDATFKTGYFGTYASEEEGVAYYDNVIIGESEAEVENAFFAVQYSGKLAATWGKVRAYHEDQGD